MRPPFRNRRPGSYWLVAIVILFLVAGLIYWLDREFGGALDEGNNAPRLVHHVLLLALVGAAVVAGFRMRAGTMIRYIAWWAGIFAVVILAYSFRTDVRGLGDRIVGELRPDLAMTSADGEVAVRRGGDGHFRLTATVDGRPVRFLVDTGATVVVLSAADAARIGLDPDTLSYSFQARTASGVAQTARISLGEVSTGPIVVRDVPAAVIRDGLSESLLGLSFLNRLSGYEVREDRMILRP
ncbi:MAG: TIGR02281 family clan AA aspartic protease [Rhodospirillaceae bacterium]